MNVQEWKDRTSAYLQERLIVVPLLFVAAALGLSQLTLAIDRNLDEDAERNGLPRLLETTVDSAHAVLSTIAGGLISAITLLLSLVLVTVQLASSQFSPRTLRDWIGDTTQQRSIGIVLGTTIYCLMVLRETRAGDATVELAPHVSVLFAVALAVVSLVGVVRSVDHLSNGMRIESVARNLAEETREALRNIEDGWLPPASSSPVPQTTQPRESGLSASRVALTATSSGWVQRVDFEHLAGCLEPGGHAALVVGPGAFVFAGQPLAWVEGSDDLPDHLASRVVTVGDSRLVDHDVAFGLLQMSDIALRALSPGVNDPNTAIDVIAHMGLVLLEAWSLPEPPSRLQHDSATIDVIVVTHEDYLDTAFAQIMRYGSGDFEVLMALQRTLRALADEVVRRELPGPQQPIDALLRELRHAVDRSDFSPEDKRRLAMA